MLKGQTASHSRRSHHWKDRTSEPSGCSEPEGLGPRKRARKPEKEILKVR